MLRPSSTSSMTCKGCAKSRRGREPMYRGRAEALLGRLRHCGRILPSGEGREDVITHNKYGTAKKYPSD